MPVGAPDSASVRRHFYGRLADEQFGTLGANQTVGFTLNQASVDDIAIVRVFAEANILCQVQSLDVQGIVAEHWDLGLDVAWDSPRHVIVQPMGGGIGVSFGECAGVAGNSYAVDIMTYVGADQNMMQIRHAKQSHRGVVVGAGATSPDLYLPEACMYDELAVWLNPTAANVDFQYVITEHDDSLAGSMSTFTGAMFTSTGAFRTWQTHPTQGVGMRFNAKNNTGGNVTVAYGYRAYRLG